MLELAEDEQQAFIEDSKKRVLGGLKASKRPTFTLVLGAQGVGKSSLTALFENAAVISPDAYVADYYAAVGIDRRREVAGIRRGVESGCQRHVCQRLECRGT